MLHGTTARAIAPVLLLLIASFFSGCARSKYRVAADREAYHTIAQRNADPRWHEGDYDINLDPRSRYFDQYDPDCPPMPKDDPASHQYMQCVNGMKGWSHWYDNGIRPELENPTWQDQLGDYVDYDETGAVKLDLDSALELAYVHAPNHQSQLETLYLSSLDVTAERFSLDTQYFGGYDLFYNHQGRLIPPALRYEPITGRYVVNPAIEANESNQLTVGRPFEADPAFQVSRRFATAGQLLVGFANSFVFQFNGPDANLSSSILSFSFLQPLLRGAGRDIALEQLTYNERALLANLRSYSQFRQGFYTLIAIGEQGVSGPQRDGSSTSLQVFGGQGALGGYIGLLEQLQQIRNSEDNLNLQLRTLARLEALLEGDLIDLVQVDQFRQNIENDRANLLQRRNTFLAALDGYKSRTLGLPPNLPVALDDNPIRQFQLVDRAAIEVQTQITQLQERVGELIDQPDPEIVQQLRLDVYDLLDPIQQQLERTRIDVSHFKESIPAREASMNEDEVETFRDEVEQLDQWMADIDQRLVELQQSLAEFHPLDDIESSEPDAALDAAPDAAPEDLNAPEPGAVTDTDSTDTDVADVGVGVMEIDPIDSAIAETVIVLRRMLGIVQGTILVQARARLESVTVESINLESEEAFQIALANRLDFMNGRAALVDSWRLIQVNADALQSVLNVTAGGDIRTARNNPLSFRAPTANVALGLRFDAPLARLIERNAYRESLINYQRNRRAYIQSRDSLHLGLRVLLRDIERLHTNLEIQRRAVAIAIRRVDLTTAELDQPVPPPQPGQRAAQFGPTAAFQLLSAQNALRDSQNAFLSTWLNYYAARMRLARELGIMKLGSDGQWIETPPPGSDQTELDSELPPPLAAGLIEAVEHLPDGFMFEVNPELTDGGEPMSAEPSGREAGLLELEPTDPAASNPLPPNPIAPQPPDPQPPNTQPPNTQPPNTQPPNTQPPDPQPPNTQPPDLAAPDLAAPDLAAPDLVAPDLVAPGAAID